MKQYSRFLLILLALSTACFYCMQDSSVGLTAVKITDAVNIIILMSFGAAITGVFGSIYVGTITVIIFTGILAIVNAYLIKFRGQALTPGDLKAARTAILVLYNYNLIPSKSEWKTIIVFATLCTGTIWVLRRYPLSFKRKERAFTAISGSLILMAICFLITSSNIIPVRRFACFYNLGAAWNGIIVNFLSNVNLQGSDVPEGYFEETAVDMLKQYQENMESDEKPNIIMVMCEAFSDPAVLGEIKSNKDYLPYFHSLSQNDKNTVSGYIYVSGIGGGTANTEYEALSGNTMYFIPEGIYPYTQMIREKTDTSYMMPEYLNHLDYRTIAMHPYQNSGYNRKNVYQIMGFKEQYFEESFENPEYIRSFISDRTLFKRIIEEYERTEEGSPFFCFAVTMQNHAFYSSNDILLKKAHNDGLSYGVSFDYTGEIKIDGEDDDSLETYLNLQYTTDQALRELIQYFDKQDERTVILFFGDHQPAPTVTMPVTGTTDINENHYKVPFFIHANFEIVKAQGIEISPNYLQTYLYDICGLSGTPYSQFLREARNKIPVIEKVKIVGNETDQFMTQYKYLQYYLQNH